MTLDEFKKKIELEGLSRDNIIERLYVAEKGIQNLKMVSGTVAIGREKLAEIFKQLIVQYSAGVSLRNVVNAVLDVFYLELDKLTPDDHTGWGDLYGTD